MKKLLKFSLYSFLTIVGLFLIFFFINALDYGYKFFFNRASLTEPWQVNAAINNVGFLVFIKKNMRNKPTIVKNEYKENLSNFFIDCYYYIKLCQGER